jgi:hypothetical protein
MGISVEGVHGLQEVTIMCPKAGGGVVPGSMKSMSAQDCGVAPALQLEIGELDGYIVLQRCCQGCAHILSKC